MPTRASDISSQEKRNTKASSARTTMLIAARKAGNSGRMRSGADS
jgi:hypothetical protein